jgi:hypothetical protein
MPIDALTIIFRFTLFGLLAYKVAQLIKIYAIPFLKEELNLEHKQQIELLEKEKLLLSTQHRLENQINHQKKTFTFLEKKALLWQSHLLKIKENNEQAAKHIATQLEGKRITQQKYVALAKDVAMVIPQVYQQVAGELAQNYAGENGKQQLSNFIAKTTSSNNKKS